MANIFAVLTAILLAASAFLALKNKEAYAKEIESRTQAESDLARSQDRLAKLQSNRAATIAEREQNEGATVTLREQEQSQESKNAGVQSEIGNKSKTRDDNATKITAIEDKLKDVGDLQDLGQQMTRLGEELAGLRDEVAGNKVTLANLLAEKNSTQRTIDGYTKINQDHSNKRSYFTSTRISSIYPTWGFVTLAAGNSSGVVSGSTLNVVRDGEVVAKLRVRSVEAGRSSADVIPDSKAEDAVLMVGDRVVPSAASN